MIQSDESRDRSRVSSGLEMVERNIDQERWRRRWLHWRWRVQLGRRCHMRKMISQITPATSSRETAFCLATILILAMIVQTRPANSTLASRDRNRRGLSAPEGAVRSAMSYGMSYVPSGGGNSGPRINKTDQRAQPLDGGHRTSGFNNNDTTSSSSSIEPSSNSSGPARAKSATARDTSQERERPTAPDQRLDKAGAEDGKRNETAKPIERRARQAQEGQRHDERGKPTGKWSYRLVFLYPSSRLFNEGKAHLGVALVRFPLVHPKTTHTQTLELCWRRRRIL